MADNCWLDFFSVLCLPATICGYISSGVWLIVLCPQIWQNYIRGSTHGLSVWWATANFFAQGPAALVKENHEKPHTDLKIT